MNSVQDITEAISSFQPLPTSQNLNKRTVRTGHLPPGANFHQHHETEGGKNVQGLTTAPSEPSETTPLLSPDQAAWIPVARQILAGECDDADGSTREALRIGLRAINHPLCRRALQRLANKPDRR